MHTIENTLFLGRYLKHLECTESTNEYALQLISKNKPPEGTVITAHKQSNGRGQIGSLWESEPGQNLTFSVILYPTFLPLSRQFALTQSLSLAVIDALHPIVTEQLSLKWPNDIYVGNKKIGGMLLQSGISQTQMAHVIVGIGINVNQTLFLSDAPNPVSLRQLLGKSVDLSVLLSTLCLCLEKRYLQLRAGEFEAIKADYLNNLYYFMEDHVYQRSSDESLFEGRIIDVQPDGKLKLMTDRGEELFSMKEIRFIHA